MYDKIKNINNMIKLTITNANFFHCKQLPKILENLFIYIFKNIP